MPIESNTSLQQDRHVHRLPVIATVLTPLERVRVDVAADGAFEVVHRSTVEELTNDVHAQQVDAVIVSVARYDVGSAARMATMVREFPTVPAFALLTDMQRSTAYSVLELGKVGVRTLIRVQTKLLPSRMPGMISLHRRSGTT